MENIYIVKKELGDELYNYLGYDDMQLDDKISLDMLFCKIVAKMDELRYKIEDLESEIRDLNSNDDDFPYEEMAGK